MTRPTHDLVTDRARRLAERQRRRESFQQAAHEIRSDRSFSDVIRRVAEESLRLQQTRDQDDGSSLSSLRETERILDALASGGNEAEAYSAYESDSEGEYSVHTNYRSSNDTPGSLPEDDGSDTVSTPEPERFDQDDPEPQPETVHPPTPEGEEAKPPTPTEEPAKEPEASFHIILKLHNHNGENIPSVKTLQRLFGG